MTIQFAARTLPAAERALQVQAWCISYLAALPEEQVALAVIREPSPVVAVANPIALADALAMPANPDEGSLLVIWVPPGAGHPADLDGELQAFMARDLAPHRAPVHASIKTIRATCSETRAVIYASPEHLADGMDAVARFTLAARQTAALEAQMTATWPQIKAHTPLTHAMTRHQQRLQPQVNVLTERATDMKTQYLRLQTAIEQLDPTLSGTSKRMYADLAEAAGLWSRLEMLEDPIQFALDHYELVNWRLTETATARKGILLEVMIVVILLADFAMRFVEYFTHSGWNWWSSGASIIP
ncbi:MAG TPA: hypothetical protein VIY51_11540 [Xanthobacteraceae bacterium]